MRNLIILSTLLFTACGQGEQTTTYKDSEGKDRRITVEDSGSTRTVTSGDGVIRAQGAQGGAKARFPAYAPQYPGATVQSVVDMDVGTATTGGVKQHTVTMMTQDTPDAVIAFYKGKIATTGKSVNEIKGGATGPMLIIGGAGMMDAEGYVTAMPVGSGGTSVNVVVQEKLPRG